MSLPWLIFGAGGHGHVVLDTLIDFGVDVKDVVFVDDNVVTHEAGAVVINSKKVRTLKPHRFIIAVGDSKARQRLFYQMQESPHFAGSVVHRYAYVSTSAQLGDGVFVGAQANIGPGSIIDDGCIINTGANVDHDCRVGAFTHIAPHANLCGSVTVGQCCLIGAGSVVKPGIRIGHGVTVGCGAAVVKNIENASVQVGVPARALRT